MKAKILPSILALLMVFGMGCLFSCGQKAEDPAKGKLKVVTTLFPLYDFARNVGGDQAYVTLLVPPGVEPHSFDPKPGDIRRIDAADVFIYTGNSMEPWVESLLKGTENKQLVVVDASRGIKLLTRVGPDEHGHDKGELDHHAGGKLDPHIWLDFERARKMVENIRDGFVAKDPAHKELYTKNAAEYNAKLTDLDERFRRGLANCAHRLFVHGGHFAFNYMARRYDLTYVSAYEGSPNAEPTPRKIMELKRLVMDNHVNYIYYEELITPRVAEVVARETKTTLLPLHGAHNISKDDLEKGATFISLMETNLTMLQKGLECR